MKDMQAGIYSPHWTIQKIKTNYHFIVYVLSMDYQFLNSGANKWSKFLSITTNSIEDHVEWD